MLTRGLHALAVSRRLWVLRIKFDLLRTVHLASW